MGCLKLTYREELPQLKVVKGFSFSEEKSCAGLYRYGFNGYEKDDEVKNITGGHLSFEDFGYDPRLARRWNIDPKTGETPWQSPYIYAADNPIAFIDIDGEGDIYYNLVIDRKSGNAAFKTVEVKDNSPDKEHFTIHFKNKDGSIDNVNVSEKTFNKARFKFIAKTTLIKTSTSTREGAFAKLIRKLKAFEFNSGSEPEPDVPFAPKSDEEGDPDGKFSRDDSDVPIKEGDLTPSGTGSDNGQIDGNESFDAVLEDRSTGKLDTIPVLSRDTADARKAMEGSNRVKKFIKKK